MLQNKGKKVAISFGNDRITYGNLMAKIEIFAELHELTKGQRAVIFSENRPGYFYAFYSIWKKSGIAVPVDFMATVSEVADILKDSNPSVVFTSSSKKADIQKAIDQAEIVTKLIIIDQYDHFEPKLISSKELPQAQDQDTAVMVYTSGTTGSPKGVMLSYANLKANIYGVSDRIPIYKETSRVLVLLPLHHILPLAGTMIIPLNVGGSVAICPSLSSEDILNTLQDNKVTIIIGVPRLYATLHKGIMDKINNSSIAKRLFSLAKSINSPKFSKLLFGTVHKKFGGAIESLVSGGAALDPNVGNDFKTLGFEVLEGFGMTEAAPMITFTRPGRVRIGSPGEALPGTKIRIINGEIAAFGANIMQGYFNRPKETSEVIKDGWLYTGDLGYMDDDGYLYITGRKKEIIILSNGKNINPTELEEKLLTSSLVNDCGVFYHEGQLNVVILPQENDKTDAELKEEIRSRLIEPFNNTVSSYKKIMQFHITNEELPRTRLGKLQRFKLADFAISTIEEDIEEEEGETSQEFKIISDFISVEKGKKVKPKDHLEMDLAMDSLDKVGLQVYINQNFGIDIEAAELSKFSTVENLAEYVAEKKTKMEDANIEWTDILKERVNIKLPESWLVTRMAMRLSKILFKIYFRFHSKGRENIPEGPCIISPNHQSFFDGLFVTSLLRTKQIKRTFFYAKSDHIKLPIIKYIARHNNVIVVDINKNLKESIQRLAEVLRHEKDLIIFPEGTRSVNGNIGQFKKTFAILSSELNIPIVPVSINGAINALPKGSNFPRPWKKIKVEFLQAVYPMNKSYEQITNEVRNKIIENLNN